MARAGASLVILSRTEAEIEETAARIRASGREVLPIAADVSRPEAVKAAVDRAVARYGSIDVLMNNAAVIGPVKPLAEVDSSEWEEAFRINLEGTYLCSAVVIPHMVRRKRGKIINVTSGLGEMVMPRLGVYSVTKAAVTHFTRILAEELRAYHIQVNALDPGVMDTRMQARLRDLSPEQLGSELYERFSRLKRDGHLKNPERVAALAVFLASKGSDRLTGRVGTESHYRRFGYSG
jgi:NAD(P)-dependent dehydrogenase (short-subunit alcohol dehydrogenase family)